jgi:hypothetical protein
LEDPFNPLVVEDVCGKPEVNVVAFESCDVESCCVDFILFKSFSDPVREDFEGDRE